MNRPKFEKARFGNETVRIKKPSEVGNQVAHLHTEGFGNLNQ